LDINVIDASEREQSLQILDAAAHCFADSGIDVASIEDIARRMSATKGKIYYYFLTKRQIVLEVWRHSIELTTIAADQAVVPEADPVEKLYAISFAHAMSMMTHQHFHRTAIECMRRPPLKISSENERALAGKIKQQQNDYESIFRDILVSGIESGVFRNAPVGVYAHSVISLLHAPAHWYRPRQKDAEANRAEIAHTIANMAVGSVRRFDGEP
jgi:AcrR family transcriptional regulator